MLSQSVARLPSLQYVEKKTQMADIELGTTVRARTKSILKLENTEAYREAYAYQPVCLPLYIPL